jgi:hypothetical protein
MNWEAIDAVGEILGAGAVFASLMYLTVHIRNSTRQLQAQGDRLDTLDSFHNL